MFGTRRGPTTEGCLTCLFMTAFSSPFTFGRCGPVRVRAGSCIGYQKCTRSLWHRRLDGGLTLELRAICTDVNGEEGMRRRNGMCKKCKEVSMQEEKRGFLEKTRRFMRLTAVVVAGKRERESRWSSRFVSARRPNSNHSRDRMEIVTETRYNSFSL